MEVPLGRVLADAGPCVLQSRRRRHEPPGPGEHPGPPHQQRPLHLSCGSARRGQPAGGGERSQEDARERTPTGVPPTLWHVHLESV
ncbi:unnamed protein product [Rangifer tarandus platyrhynchus]|uniref:Uncharacterized protein n=1 Tax=Rangifer tarandus platyrhynchus TaxID=3082113 RepID=A0AC59ZKS9_RANTA